MPLNLLHVQDLTAQRQDSLEMTVTTRLSRTTGRITLNEEDLTFLRILIRAVSQLTRQSTTRHRILTLHTLTSLTGCNTGCSSQNHLLADRVSLLGMLLQVVVHSLTNSLLHCTIHLTVT